MRLSFKVGLFSFLFKKTLQFAVGMLIAAAIIFSIISLTPGKITEIHSLSEATAHSLHLDTSIPVQFIYWTLNAIRLNFGLSLTNGTPVTELIVDYAPATMQLALGSLVITLLISLPLAIYFAFYPESKITQLLSTIVYSISSTPVFVVGYIVLALIFNLLKFYPLDPPLEDAPLWHHLTFSGLPMLVLGLGNGTLGEFVRILQLEIETVNRSLYIKSARARGVKLFRHFFRPVLIPFLSIIVSRFAILLGGVIVVERIFNRHGLGWLTWEATLNRDFFVIMAVAFLTVLLVRALMLAQDIIIYQIDPRQRT